MIQIGAKKTMERLDEMLTSAIDGTFAESRYDETELSRLEARWKQYLTASQMCVEQTDRERENLKRLVSDISHQTRLPLSNILLYAELMEERADTEEEKLLSRQILEQTEKLEFLIQSLVKLSRLETDVLEVVPKVQSLRALVVNVQSLFAAKAEAKGICLKFQEGEDVTCAYDRKWTGEALGNVVDNAIKYSPAGSCIRLRINAFSLYACIEVEDEGIGISEEERAQVFGRFYRGREVQQEKGIGIGLYLTREILEKENGYIKVQSKKGQGSVFSLYLPRAEGRGK